MDNLPAKPPVAEPAEVEVIPTWRELGERFRDLMTDIGAEISRTWKQEGRELEREAQARLLPALKRAKVEIEKMIGRLEERLGRKEP